MENQELLSKFKEDLQIKHYSPKSIASYEYCLKRLFAYLGNRSLKELTREDILNYQLRLKQSGYSLHTIERHLHSLKGFYKYLEKIFYILVNPCENLILRKVPHRIPVVLTEGEVKRILNQPNVSTLAGIRDKALLETLYSTGIRIGELYNLTIFDIDLSSGFLRVNKGKYSKDRFAPLTKAACTYLKQYIENVRPKFTKNQIKEQALFVGARGKRLHTLIIANLIRNYAKAVGIKKRVTCHTFRHTCATHLLENDVDIFKIQKLLGHSRASTTQMYTRVTPRQIKQAHREHHPREREKAYGK
jgi:integrase/recombinase XerD